MFAGKYPDKTPVATFLWLPAFLSRYDYRLRTLYETSRYACLMAAASYDACPPRPFGRGGIL